MLQRDVNINRNGKLEPSPPIRKKENGQQNFFKNRRFRIMDDPGLYSLY